MSRQLWNLGSTRKSSGLRQEKTAREELKLHQAVIYQPNEEEMEAFDGPVKKSGLIMREALILDLIDRIDGRRTVQTSGREKEEEGEIYGRE